MTLRRNKSAEGRRCRYILRRIGSCAKNVNDNATNGEICGKTLKLNSPTRPAVDDKPDATLPSNADDEELSEAT
jgi:hypothetical protein